MVRIVAHRTDGRAGSHQRSCHGSVTGQIVLDNESTRGVTDNDRLIVELRSKTTYVVDVVSNPSGPDGSLRLSMASEIEREGPVAVVAEELRVVLRPTLGAMPCTVDEDDGRRLLAA